MKDIKVVVYGASGYTGEYVMWKLAERGIPFIAAGRNKQRLEQRITSRAELKGAHYEIAEVKHDEAALSELFKGRAVVINLVGPFAQFGEPVIRAALATGCHYLDPSGEQDWKIMIRDRYGRAFADRDLVLSPACSLMWLAGLLAAEAALEKPGVDSVDIVYAVVGVPSAASTLSFMRMCCQPQLRLVQGRLEAWAPATHFQVTVPGIHEILTALPWSGGGESLFLQDDPRVRNCQTLIGFRNRTLMDLVIRRMEEFAEKYAHLSAAEQEDATNKWALEIAPSGDMAHEDLTVHRTIFSCHGRGTVVAHSVALWGATGYVFTGVAMSAVVEWLLAHRQKAVGFQPATKVLGVPRLRAELEEAGVLGQPVQIIR